MLNKYLTLNNKRIAYRSIDGEAVVIDLKDNTFHILNPVSTYIWERLNGEIILKDIIKALTEEFDVDQETAAKDCLEFIDELIKINLVVLNSH